MSYVCPSSHQEFNGNCPITNCPANIAHVQERPSGCFYIYMKKASITKIDLAFAFNIPLSKMESLVNKGRRRIECVTILMKILPHIRDLKLRHCPCCQVVRTSEGPCVNTVKCKERQDMMAVLMRQSVFKLADLKMTAADIFRLLHQTDFANALIRRYNKDLTVSDLFMLRKSALETLLELSPSV